MTTFMVDSQYLCQILAKYPPNKTEYLKNTSEYLILKKACMSIVQQTEYPVQKQEEVVAAVSYVLDPYLDLHH